VFDWSSGIDPSGISYYILIIDNESDPIATPGYVYIFNTTNTYCELPEILPPGEYHFFLAQVDGVGQQSEYTIGIFTVIKSTPRNNTFLIIGIILASVVGSVTAIVLVRRKLKKTIAPPREKIPLKIISSHINKLSNAQLSLKVEEIQSIADEKEIETHINEIKDLGEELFNEGAYLEAQKQFMLGRDLLIDLGEEEEAKLISDLISGIEGLIEEREKRIELLERIKIEGNSVQVFELYHEIMTISKKLRDPESTSFYQSELIQFFQVNNFKLIDLEEYRNILEQKADSLLNNNQFEIAAEIYEKCEMISQIFIQLERDGEVANFEKFRNLKTDCLDRIREKKL
jgi:tetratricopeptide (TPR) repeat protein